jgi:Dolichyl-phosphate-mannose-protein mannosyltransferase
MDDRSPSVIAPEDLTASVPQMRSVGHSIIALSAIYAILIFAAMQRRVWYDELFTFDIARAATFPRLIELTRKWDLNPPLSYVLSRWSMIIFGAGKVGLRLPSILEFYAASLFLFAFARKHIGNAFALLAVLTLWNSTFFYYATEARPYALLLMCFSVVLYNWDRAIAPRRSTWTLVWVFFGSLGTLLSHVFAPLTLASIFVAEFVRFAHRRKADVWLWVALLLPCLAMVTYIPLFQTYSSVLFPPDLQASFHQIRQFYESTMWDGLAVPVIYGLLLAFAINRSRPQAVSPSRVWLEHTALATYLVLTPILLNIVLMRGHRIFWPRYCITAGVAAYLVCAFVFAYRSGIGRRGAYAVVATLAAAGMLHSFSSLRLGTGSSDASVLNDIKPDLPVVDADGFTFFEMNHFEEPRLLNRVYFLKDRASAIRYGNDTLFEDFEPPDRLGPDFPIHAHVDDYQSFIQQHKQFLVLGTPDHWAGTWLLDRLVDDGSRVEKIRTLDIPYNGRQLYLVSVLQPQSETHQ